MFPLVVLPQNNRYRRKLKENRKAKVSGLTPQEVLCLKWRDVKTIVGHKGTVIHHVPKEYKPVPPPKAKCDTKAKSGTNPGSTPRKRLKLARPDPLPDLSPVKKADQYTADMQAALQNSRLDTAYIDLTQSSPKLVNTKPPSTSKHSSGCVSKALFAPPHKH